MRYNIAPSQEILAVTKNSRQERRASFLRWGLIPFWVERPALFKKLLINARSEEVWEKKSFSRAIAEKRCLIPANGFFEWKGERTNKRPYLIKMKDFSPFAFAGIWEKWEGREGNTLSSCAILTTRPNKLVREIHDRMPVILKKEDHALWLGEEEAGQKELARLFEPFDPSPMEAYPVLKLVGNPSNDGPQCIERAGKDSLFD